MNSKKHDSSRFKKLLALAMTVLLVGTMVPFGLQKAYAAEGFPGFLVGAEVKIIADDSLTAKFDKRKDSSLKNLIGPNKWISVDTLSNYAVVYKDKIDQGKYKDGLSGAATEKFFSYSSGEDIKEKKYSEKMKLVEQFLPADIQENDPILPIYEKITEELKKEGEYIRETFKNADVSSRKNAGFNKLPAIFVSEADATTEKIAGDSKKYGKVGKGVRIAAVMVDKPVEYVADQNTTKSWSIDLNNPITSDDLARHNIPENLTPLRTTGYEADLKKSLWLGYILANDRRTDITLEYEAQSLNDDATATINYRFEIKLVELKIPVKYEYLSQDSSIELPSDIKDKAKELNQEYGFGDKVDAKSVGDTTVTSDVDGSQWTFVGWMTNNEGATEDSNLSMTKSFKASDYNDNNDPKVNKFIGVWKRTGEPVAKKGTVSYEFIGKDNVPLPTDITDLLPDPEQHEIDAQVTAKGPGKEATPVTELTVGEYDWKFNGYSHNDQPATELTVKDGENKFVGEWERLYRVNYKLNYPSKETEDHKVVNKIPKDGTTGKNHPSNPTRPDGPDNKKWTFVGWHTDKDHDPNNEDGMFTSSTPITDNTTVYAIWKEKDKERISYEYQAAQGVTQTLPQVINGAEFLPDSNGSEYYVDDPVTADKPKKESYQDATGTWTFVNYKDNSLTVTKGGENKFIGYWAYAPESVPYTHEFKADPSAGRGLPDILTKKVKDGGLIPDDKNGNLGTDVSPDNPSRTEVKVEDGKWTFNSYDKQSLTLTRGGDNKFVGTWNFVAKTNYSYRYVAKAGSAKTLPDAIQGFAPAVQGDHYVGDSVQADNPTQNEYPDETGKWVFSAYTNSPLTLKADAADNVLIGEWEYVVERKSYSYKFVSGTDDKELPTSINNLVTDEPAGLRPVGEEVDLGTEVTAEQPSRTTVEVPEEQGRWIFQGYDNDKITVNRQGPNLFTGTWIFQKVIPSTPLTYFVKHNFVAEDGSKLPDQVTKLTPKNVSGKANGEEVSPTAPEQTVVRIPQDDGSTIVWTFKSWDKQKDTINNDNVTFTGTWSSHKEVPSTALTYFVIHKFNTSDGSPVPQEVLKYLPPTVGGKANGTPVQPTAPGKTRIEVPQEDGTMKVWTFKSWDKESDTINNDNVVFTGTWVPSDPNPEPSPDPDQPITPKKVTVIYKHNYPNPPSEEYSKVPNLDKGSIVKDKHPNDPTRPCDDDGCWEFTGWNTDPDGNGKTFTSSTPVEDDITVYAQWKKTPKDPDPDPKPNPDPDQPITPEKVTVIYKHNYPNPPSEDYSKVPGIEKGTSVGNKHPNDPTRPCDDDGCWEFVEWNTDPDGNGESFTSGTPVNGNITVYAIWKKKPKDPDPKPDPEKPVTPVEPEKPVTPINPEVPAQPVVPSPETPKEAPKVDHYKRLPKTADTSSKALASGLALSSALILSAGYALRRKKA